MWGVLPMSEDVESVLTGGLDSYYQHMQDIYNICNVVICREKSRYTP